MDPDRTNKSILGHPFRKKQSKVCSRFAGLVFFRYISWPSFEHAFYGVKILKFTFREKHWALADLLFLISSGDGHNQATPTPYFPGPAPSTVFAGPGALQYKSGRCSNNSGIFVA